MIAINMPAGGIQYVRGEELLWFRKAFDSEWKGALVLQLSTDRIYSTESVDDLVRKLSDAGVPLAKLTPPDADLALYVNADGVHKVDQGNPIIFPDKARSVLGFSGKLRLAVREEVKEATSLLGIALAKAFS
jgi:hypothetical protein